MDHSDVLEVAHWQEKLYKYWGQSPAQMCRGICRWHWTDTPGTCLKAGGVLILSKASVNFKQI